jgi:hypothetical protein
MTNQQWIAKGSTGCTFATLFSKTPEVVGWRFLTPGQWWHLKYLTDELPLIVSIEFNNDGYWNKKTVREWALSQGFYEEETSPDTIGLRIQCKQGVAWVQYFGPDSHVKTRQSPTPMLLYTNHLGKAYYVKVGFKGILHLAHAWYHKISERVYDLLWERSYQQTKKKIGHAPTIVEAAKTTWKKEDICL